MSNWDILDMCFRNLIKRKLRTSLTVLGVMIGTASIVVMISLGLAINDKFAKAIDEMGDVTIVTVYNPNSNRYYYSDSQTNVTGDAPNLDDNAILSFERLKGVVVASPVAQATLYFKSGKYYMYAWNVFGIKPEAMSLLGYAPEQGRLLQDGDKYEVVFGKYAETNFQEQNSMHYEDRFWKAMSGEEIATYVDVFKDKITMSYDQNYIWGQQSSEEEYDFEDENAPKPIKPYDIKVVGLLESKNDWNADQGVFMDIDVVKKLKSDGERQEQVNREEWGSYSASQGNKDTGYETAYVKCTDLTAVRNVKEQITEMGFFAQIPTEWLDYMQESMSSIQALLGAIGAVSLFVAAIGIANTMIMATYERTREIGIMKVIGAALSDIRRLFLLEAAMLGFFGGLFGVLLSVLVSYVLNNAKIPLFGNMMGYLGESGEGGAVSLITPWLCGMALLFASVVGLLSGYFPARRAMRLSALSAIRTE